MIKQGNNISMAKNIMNSSDDKYKENGSNHAEDSETIIRINLNERLAEEIRKNGIDCKAVKVSSLSLEQKPYFSNNFAMSSKFITNKLKKYRYCADISEKLGYLCTPKFLRRSYFVMH
jgi:hypothetical protein